MKNYRQSYKDYPVTIAGDRETKLRYNKTFLKKREKEIKDSEDSCTPTSQLLTMGDNGFFFFFFFLKFFFYIKKELRKSIAQTDITFA